MEGAGHSEEEITEEKYCPLVKAEEVITDDIPNEASVSPFPVKLIKASTGKEIRIWDERRTSDIFDASKCIKIEPVGNDAEIDKEGWNVPECDSDSSSECDDPVFHVKTEIIDIKDDVEITAGSSLLRKDVCHYEETTPSDVSTSSGRRTNEMGEFSYVEVDQKECSSRQDVHTRNIRKLSTFSQRKAAKNGFDCKRCGKTFELETQLFSHLLLHSDLKLYECKTCHKYFRNCQNLKRHEYCHSNERCFSCDICSKKYKSQWDLRAHRKLHDKGKCLLCDVCGKPFIRKSELARHVFLHTTAKPYSCSICKATFTQKSRWRDHFDSHTGVKFACNNCYKTFSTRSLLVRHQKIHNKDLCHFCDVCKKPFTYKSLLAQHMVVHAGLKQYRCNVCQRSFARLSNLKQHEAVHTSRVLTCETCSKTYSSISGFRKHQSAHRKQLC